MRMRAVTTFFVGTDQGERKIDGGDVYDAKHPLVVACPGQFEALPEDEVPQQPNPRRRRG